ncbi:hypothetical protein, partial [Salmonella sp. s55004]|uniref:hypothetical protein n=1 Tax=Salmonella sp. s55004 TaxID=3159675 RepID=UPI00397F92B2
HAADVAFWREAQAKPGDALAAELEAQPPQAVAEGKRKRRRRRRRGGEDAAGADIGPSAAGED